MIKLNIEGLEDIANEYYSQLSRKKRKANTKCHEYYLDHFQDFVLCKMDNFKQMIHEFNIACQDQKDEYDEKRQVLNDYVYTHKSEANSSNKEIKKQYNLEKDLLKDAMLSTEFSRFYKYMVNQYTSSFQEEIYLPKSNYNGEKLGTWLAASLNVNTCPYCNRLYTFTVTGEKGVRPEFDHFLPKSIYPYFSLSFYNLIPCCPVCNHIKKEQEISLHPYDQGFGDEYAFQINKEKYLNHQKMETITFKSLENNSNIKIFKLDELYKMHLDYINEILNKAHAYEENYYDGLISSFHNLAATPQEIDRLIWGNYVEVAEHSNRPLSKLTSDILKQLGICTVTDNHDS